MSLLRSKFLSGRNRFEPRPSASLALPADQICSLLEQGPNNVMKVALQDFISKTKDELDFVRQIGAFSNKDTKEAKEEIGKLIKERESEQREKLTPEEVWNRINAADCQSTRQFLREYDSTIGQTLLSLKS